MKKILTIFLFLGAFCACQLNELDDVVGGNAEFFAKIEDNQLSKTLLDEDKNVIWAADDQLTIFRKSTLGVKYQIQSQYVGKNHGGFSKVTAEDPDDFYDGMTLAHNVAFYPYVDGLDCSNASSDGSTGSYLVTGVIFPQTQIYAPESFGNGSFPMVAVSANNELTFRNLCGGMKLQLKGEQKVTSITINGNDNEILAGNAFVTAYADGSAPVVEIKDRTYASVILDCGEGVQLNKDVATSFIIALPPVEFSKGFKVTVTDAEGKTNVIRTEARNTVLRSSLLAMPPINVSDADFIAFDISLKEVVPGRIVLNTVVPSEKEFAYIISEEPLEVNGEIVFMEGTSDVLDTDGEYEIFAEVKENTKYYIYAAVKLGDTEFSKVQELIFESGTFEFNELCTLTSVMYDGFKMHVNVPSSVENCMPGQAGSRAIRYAMGDIMTYNLMAGNSYQALLYNAGKYITEDTTLDYSDNVNFAYSDKDLNGDGVVNEEDVELLWNPVRPGEPIIFLAGEFEWMQCPPEYQEGGIYENRIYMVNGWEYPHDFPAGYYLPCADADEYYNLPMHSNDAAWTGAFQRKLFRTRIPGELKANVNMEILDLGPVEATIEFTPDSAVEFYYVAVLDESSYNMMLELLDGKEEYLQWATSSDFTMFNFGSRILSEPIQIHLSDYFVDVSADTKYHVLITGVGDRTCTKQCFNHYTFNTPQKTKTKGPSIVVEALESESTPFMAKFRIKCTSFADDPAKRCYYGANYVKEWVRALNSGATYLSYGQQEQFSGWELDKINSEEGLIVDFPTIDGETTRLVVVAYNDENIPNDLNYEDITECPAVADLTTPYYEANFCGAYYDMVDKLAGDWTMSATVLGADGKKVTAKKNVSILSEYTDYPSVLPQEVYDIYTKHTKWTKAEIDGYWEDFKKNAKIFNRKRLEYQNKLALVGWLDGGVYGAYETMLPYDLFVSETISTLDVKSMFSDFGPKMYIEVKEESGKPKLTITADMPVSNWSIPFYLAARSDAETNNTYFYYEDLMGNYNAPLVFDVEASDNYNTLTIKGIVGNGAVFYPNVIGKDFQTGRYMLDYPILSDVVLTKGHTAAKTYVRAARRVSVNPQTEGLDVSHKHYTRFDKPAKTVKMEVMTQEKVQENLVRYRQRLMK